jgi:hypothetical protein
MDSPACSKYRLLASTLLSTFSVETSASRICFMSRYHLCREIMSFPFVAIRIGKHKKSTVSLVSIGRISISSVTSNLSRPTRNRCCMSPFRWQMMRMTISRSVCCVGCVWRWLSFSQFAPSFCQLPIDSCDLLRLFLVADGQQHSFVTDDESRYVLRLLFSEWKYSVVNDVSLI